MIYLVNIKLILSFCNNESIFNQKILFFYNIVAKISYIGAKISDIGDRISNIGVRISDIWAKISDIGDRINDQNFLKFLCFLCIFLEIFVFYSLYQWNDTQILDYANLIFWSGGIIRNFKNRFLINDKIFLCFFYLQNAFLTQTQYDKFAI